MSGTTVESKLHIDGNIYSNLVQQETEYIETAPGQRRKCKARAKMNDPIFGAKVIVFHLTESTHEHPPNQEECAAAVVSHLKRKATINQNSLHPSCSALNLVVHWMMSSEPITRAGSYIATSMRQTRCKFLPSNLTSSRREFETRSE